LIREAAVQQAELAILNAPFEEGGWEKAIVQIMEATRSSGAHLLGMGGPLLLPLNVSLGVSGIDRYLGDPHFHGRTNWRVGSTTVAMAIQHEGDYARYRNAHDTTEYDDVASDLDIQFGCQSAVLLDQQQLLGLALLRSRRDGPCTEETLRRFAILRHQLARAVRMQIALAGEAAEMMIGDLGPLHGATLLLDLHGSLCALTPAAEHLFDEGGPLKLTGLAVELHDADDNVRLQRALARLLASDGRIDVLVHEMHVGRREERPERHWRLFVVRLPHRPNGLGFDPHLAITLTPRS